ncbi:MAG TPA: NYN domain-containing protein [Longimicrobiales bacterium]
MSGPTQSAPNAALLIDFDNVTMGIRSDLSKELKSLLNSDIIKGKVAVQRAYADWRRYPQYIVPLAEASVDLIFAPAYGSSKKNATDIRLAIDALELVFTRPEIGTYILLSGDSDFSSLVLKLKEYGKYVIGVGIRESASDLLVQNCDEYYSYSVLSGLTKEDDEARESLDPWVLAEKAVRKMAAQHDIMRSDRLKQVMLELDPNFNEKELGYSKFSKFLSDAVARGCLHLKKADNGQWEVAPVERPTEEAAPEAAKERETRASREDGRRSRGRGRDRDRSRASERRDAAAPERDEPAPREDLEPAAQAEAPAAPDVAAQDADPLAAAYALLRRAVGSVTENGGSARDSDVKRRMLELKPGWDESTLGFSKFSRFLRQAHDAEVIDLQKVGNGTYEIVLPGGRVEPSGDARPNGRGRRGSAGRAGRRDAPAANGREAVVGADETAATPAPEPKSGETAGAGATRADAKAGTPAGAAEKVAKAEESVPQAGKSEADGHAAAGERAAPADAGTKSTPVSRTGTPGIGFRRGTRGRAAMAGPPPLLPGQTVRPRDLQNAKAGEPERAGADAGRAEAPAASKPASDSKATRKADVAAAAKDAKAPLAPELAGLPTEADGIVAYLSTRYKGVGKKTAEALVEAFGAAGVFRTLHGEPDRVREVLGARRAESLLNAWQSDLEHRRAEAAAEIAEAAQSAEPKPAAKKAAKSTKAEAKSTKSTRSRARKGASKAAKSKKAASPEAEATAAAVDVAVESAEAPAEPKKAGGRSRGRRGGRKRARPKVEAGAD